MLKESLMLYKVTSKMSEQLIPLVNLLEIRADEHSANVVEEIDLAFAARESLSTLEELTKRIRKLQTLCESLAAKQMIGDPIRTEFCTASPKPRIWYKIPYKRGGNEEEFDGIMKTLGVPSNVYENELVRFHGPGVADYCTKMIGECKEPPFKDVVTTELGITMRKTRDVSS